VKNILHTIVGYVYTKVLNSNPVHSEVYSI